ncbi:MAG: mechanosensitive ion channel [Opitutae bacterium]|jgi:miniconductance mechanosensitive channel|nr:mechanosensitive ion channel [Opitutae bacterium]
MNGIPFSPSELSNWFVNALGVSGTVAEWLSRSVAILVLIALASLVNGLVKGIALKLIRSVVKHSGGKFGNALLEVRFFQRLSHLAPAILVKVVAPWLFADSPSLLGLAEVAVNIYLVVIGLFVFDALLNAGLFVYQHFEISKRLPLKGLAQALKIIINATGVIFVLSILFDKSPLYFISGLGALTAVLLLIFKDALLGLVAGIQLSVNNLVRKGDWIEMPKYGADGNVLEVSLTTVKVQNWDKTITSIPPYALVTDSFKNWRGMSESGGRRIKRSISLDLNSIQFVNEALNVRLEKIELLQEYLEEKKKEVADHNKLNRVDLTELVNGRRLTNAGTFRAYCIAYLKSSQNIHQTGMTFLVRQLAPTEKGLPIEIYVFVKDVNWVSYEGIQGDIFDHLLASLDRFDLKAFQLPTGGDVSTLAEAVTR